MTSTPSQSSIVELQDPNSQAYRKARRLHLKTTRNRDQAAIESEWTPFRAAEKKFKAKFPPPDLSGVLDLALLECNGSDGLRDEEVQMGGWRGALGCVEVREIGLDLLTGDGTELGKQTRRAFTFPEIPGLVLLPSCLSHTTQRSLIQWSLRDHAKYPTITNLDTHYVLPREGVWNAYLKSRDPGYDEEAVQPVASILPTSLAPPSPSPGRTLITNPPASPESFSTLLKTPLPPPAPSSTIPPLPPSSLISKLRWANLGWFYHWGTKQYDFKAGKGEMGEEVKDICKKIVRGVRWGEVFGREGESVLDSEEGNFEAQAEWGEGGEDWMDWSETYEPDAGIVNFYQTKDTLMAHVDRSEICATSPLVSISLGSAAVFLIGGLTRSTPPIPILLRSGDVVIMSGPACRRAYHGVPRILENTLPPHLVALGPTASDSENQEWEPYAEYLRHARINVNVRQVFPKGFDPNITK
ncbi:hypothetical protein JAAARDRAFT_33136 [Jaapia argillacea MUCL 33604]|uniref:Fe2OG dioxygenase domain-containing protein n=1 Tax=Jaapia argillacea MUCL 33604 TaxID=933084 RepID=A0A067PXK6_9AGAM|nr:hypothetical protein JAAARDRAFT_33136 [Jaapia argillacea MUCL 33604]